MNKHIELVKKWLDDPTSVSQDELEANSVAAHTAYVAAHAAYVAAYAAASAYAADAYDADAAEYYVKKYEELTGE